MGQATRPSLVAGADALYDSARIPHKVRWDLPLPDPAATRAYLASTLEQTLARVGSGRLTEGEAYFVRLAVFHEDMHDEAFLYTRQTRGLPAPRFAPAPPETSAPVPAGGDVLVPGGRFLLGARPGEAPFVFDNEKWGHEVEVAPFRMARHAVTEGEFEAFVEDGGYQRRALWSEAGWAWREREEAEAPWAWVREGGRWWRRRFDRVVPLAPARADGARGLVRGRGLLPLGGAQAPQRSRVGAGGDVRGRGGRRSVAFPGARRRPAASMRGSAPRPAPRTTSRRAARAHGPLGLSQLWGNVWEWTSSDFAPYPGFVPDPYKEYSEPWFGNHKVLRGGCFATQARLLRITWRNFYMPDRRDVWAGLRTCALERG